MPSSRRPLIKTPPTILRRLIRPPIHQTHQTRRQNLRHKIQYQIRHQNSLQSNHEKVQRRTTQKLNQRGHSRKKSHQKNCQPPLRSYRQDHLENQTSLQRKSSHHLPQKHTTLWKILRKVSQKKNIKKKQPKKLRFSRRTRPQIWSVWRLFSQLPFRQLN